MPKFEGCYNRDCPDPKCKEQQGKPNMRLREWESLTLTVIMAAWVVTAIALIWQRQSLAAMGLQ